MESHIEIQLAQTALALGSNCFQLNQNHMSIGDVRQNACTPLVPTIYPQVAVGHYRADFVFVRTMLDGEKRLCVVECDGHEFHERTREQAQHDKQRDRYFTKQGLKVLRFTGSEIYRDPAKCLLEVLEVL